MFTKRQRVTVPDPDGQGRIAATFQEVDPSSPGEVSDPRVEGGIRTVDQAWIVYSEGERVGTSDLVPCTQIEAAD